MPNVTGRISLAFDNNIRDGWVTLEEVETTMLAQTGVLSGGLSSPQTHPDTHELVRAQLALSYDSGTTNKTTVKAALEAVLGVSTSGKASDGQPVPDPLVLFDPSASGPDGFVLTGWPAFPAGAKLHVELVGGNNLGVPGVGSNLSIFDKDSAGETYNDLNPNPNVAAPGSNTAMLFVFSNWSGGEYVIPANSIRINDTTTPGVVDLVHGTLTLDPAAGLGGFFWVWVTNEKEMYFADGGANAAIFKNVPALPAGNVAYADAVVNASRKWGTL